MYVCRQCGVGVHMVSAKPTSEKEITCWSSIFEKQESLNLNDILIAKIKSPG